MTALEALDELVKVGKAYNTDGVFEYLERFYKEYIDIVKTALKDK